jgi:adenine-specific DNA-methyltransferase
MHVTTAADAFGGIGTVGSALRAAGVHVSTCDLLLLPHAFQYSRIVCSRPALLVGVRRALGMSSAQHVLDHLRRKRLTNSWIVRDFSRRRQFFTEQNASAIAGVWDQIRRWNIAGLLSESDRQQLIAGLINSADLVANTAGTYYAHLKFWHRKALKRFDLKLLEVPRGQPRGEALIGDAYERLAGRAFDLLYLDPPYNSRDYARYYHLPESMASLKHPQTSVHSLSGVPRAVSETSANFRRTLRLDYIENLVTAVKWKRLVVQYSDGAAIPLDELRRFLRSIGSAKEHRLPALGYTTSNRSRDHLHHLFVIDNGTSTASRCLR